MADEMKVQLGTVQQTLFRAFVAGDRAVLVITAQGVADAQLLQAASVLVPHG